MAGFRSITPGITVNTGSAQLRTEILNTFSRLDGQLSAAPYRISTQNGPSGNAGGTETDLMSFQLDYNTLSNTGSSILIFACGRTAANGNNKTLKLNLGGTTIFTSGALAMNDIDWTLQTEIVANGDTSQIAWSQFCRNGSSPIVDVLTASEDLGTNLDITFTGTGTANDDISIYYYKAILLT
jgi:hypothetical protein